MEPVIKVEGLRKTYSATVAVDEVSFVVRKGEINVLLILGILKLPSGVDAFDTDPLCAPPSLFKADTRRWSSSNMVLRKIPHTIPHQYPF
jgi:hypothetical protein